jgi:hypothetical protein
MEESMSNPNPGSDDDSVRDAEQPEQPEQPEQAAGGSGVGAVNEEDYALGRTSDPDGAEREEPAGEDYAGSGF